MKQENFLAVWLAAITCWQERCCRRQGHGVVVQGWREASSPALPPRRRPATMNHGQWQEKHHESLVHELQLASDTKGPVLRKDSAIDVLLCKHQWVIEKFFWVSRVLRFMS